MYAFSRDAYYRTLECEPADIYAKRAIVRHTQTPPPQQLEVGDSPIVYHPLVIKLKNGKFPHIHGRFDIWGPLPNLQEPPFLSEPRVYRRTVHEQRRATRVPAK